MKNRKSKLNAQKAAVIAIRYFIEQYKKEEVGGMTLKIPPPIRVPKNHQFVGREKEKADLFCSLDAGLNPVIISSAGQGKTSLVNEVAKESGRPVYVLNGHEDLTAESLLTEITPTGSGQFEYVVQPLLAAVISGGILVIDEINRLNDSAMASLYSLLDARRTVSSSIFGMTFKAAEGFSMFGLANPFPTPLLPAADQRLRPILKWRDYTPAEVLEIVNSLESLTDSRLDEAYKRVVANRKSIPVRSALTILKLARTSQASNPERDPDEIISFAVDAVLNVNFTEGL
ncbi:MAG: AAA family ATPase [Verrucomicrobiales bacterium]|nr:AAA family ATPase [Verrucomicrobiales bacterium]